MDGTEAPWRGIREPGKRTGLNLQHEGGLRPVATTGPTAVTYGYGDTRWKPDSELLWVM